MGHIGPDIQKVRIGASQIFYKGHDLGHTLDGVEFMHERNFEDLTVDKYGDTPIDKALIGQKLTVKFKLAQPLFDSLNQAIPESNEADFEGGSRVNLGTDAGYLLRGDAGVLVLHPLAKDADDDSEDINLYKAVSVGNVELSYKVNEQRAVEVTMEALVDESYDSGRRLGHVGPADVS